MDGAVSVVLARAKNREKQRQCAYVGSSIWSWSKTAVRATEAGKRGVCLAIAHRRFPSPVATYRWETEYK